MKTLETWTLFEESGFFNWMRHRLEKAKEKYQDQKLRELDFPVLVEHLLEEIGELRESLGSGDNFQRANELCDVANMCGFVYAKIKQLNE